jgi:trehalose synthase-fused probable maltokinase
MSALFIEKSRQGRACDESRLEPVYGLRQTARMSHEPTLLSSPDVFAPGEMRRLLEEEVLPAYILRCRWFGGKARDPIAFKVRAVAAIAPDVGAARLIMAEVKYPKGPSETYLLPLQIAHGTEAATLEKETPQAIVARLEDGGAVFDAVYDAAFRAGLFALIASESGVRSESGVVRGVAGEDVPGQIPTSRVLAVEQSNTAIVYGESLFVKLYRRLEEGVNPDAEILRFLGKHSFPHVPAFRGAVEFQREGGETQVLALAAGMVPNQGDAWSFTLQELGRQCTAVLQGRTVEAEEIETAYSSRVTQLGQHTAAMHRALAIATTDPEFAAEPLTPADFTVLSATVQASLDQVLDGLARRIDGLDAGTRKVAAAVLAGETELRRRIAALASQPVAATKTRTHGDYHLGQVLNTGVDFVIIDFEGEPAKPLAARREKRSPLRDVAGMMRSFHYAAYSVLGEFPEQRTALEPVVERWHERVTRAFFEAWIAGTRGASFVPASPADLQQLYQAFVLEKALYEVIYEFNNRPTWLGIPLRGVAQLLRGV